MAPPGSAKRKRPDRQYSQEDGSNRPSPHRPESLPMAQYGNQPSNRGGRGRGRGRREPSYTHANSSARNQASAPSQMSTQAKPIAKDLSPPADPLRSVLPPDAIPADDPNTPTVPYDYDYVTEEIAQAWDESGREAFLGKLERDAVVLIVAIQELIRSGLDRRLKPQQAGATISTLIEQDRQAEEQLDVQSIFLDAISLLDEKEQRRRALYDIVAATGIDPQSIRYELDVPLLVNLQFVRPSFNQMRTRKTTNVLYRQANYNLLREESEGYAKLITEFYNTSHEASREGADPESGKQAFNRVMALVGAFDLDVGRVLDVILDISANTLVKAYRFYLKFYRYSSWWPQQAVFDNINSVREDLSGLPGWALPSSGKYQYDEQDKASILQQRQERDLKFWPRVAEKGMAAFLEIGARRITDFDAVLPLLEQEVEPTLDAKGKEVNPDKRKRINDARKYMRETRTLPPQGNTDAAQLLGFKLRFYASSVRDKTDVLPDNLIYLAALLIKVGFISFNDLYPHLHPSDEAMESEKTRLEKEKDEKERSERPGGGMNALAAAAALTDDSIPAVRTLRADNAKSGGATPKPEKKDETTEEALPEPLNQKLILLRALLAIGALPEALYILGKFPWLVEVDISLPQYLLRIIKVMLSGLTASVRPLAQEADTQQPRPLLQEMAAGSDGLLKTTQRPGGRLRKWLGLESVDSGDGFAERHYYNDWEENIPICQTIDDFFVLCNTFINLVGVKVGNNVVILSTMIRLAKQSLTDDFSEVNQTRWLDLIRRLILPALSISKHNPGLTAEMYGLLQLFSVTTRYGLYEEWYFGKTSRNPDVKAAFNRNRAEVKDVLRRITNESGKKMARALGKVSYSSPGIVMMTFINQLESYSNMIPGLVESVRYFTPFAWDVLTWVLIRSFSGQGRDRIQADGMLTSPWLQALSQFAASLFTRYSSIDPSPVLQYIASELRNGDSTNLEVVDQVVSEMSGIKSDMNYNETQILAMSGGEALQSVIVQQLADTRHLRKSSAKRLMKALSEPGITAQILISIAQERHMYAHRDTAVNMPLKVLGNNLDKIQQVFAQYLEMLKANMTPMDFKAQIPDVFGLIRDFGIEAGIAFSIYRIFIARLMAQSDAIRRRRTKASTIEDDTSAELGEAEEEEDYLLSASTLPDAKDFNTWYPFLDDYAQQLPAVSEELGQRISPLFYTVFWSFALEHVNAPLNIYEDETKRINAQLDTIAKDRASTSANAVKEKEKKASALKEVLAQLRGEMSSRVSIFGDTKKWFAARKKDWFPVSSAQEEIDQRHLNLLQECFLPRALLSSLDAQYCFSIIKTLHSVATSGFSIIALLDQFLQANLLSSIIFQSTAREAENLGHFLCEVLRFLSTWHTDKSLYEKEAHGSRRNLLGLATKVDEDGTPLEQLEWEDFRKKLFHWHIAIKDALKACFESGEYMQIRNGIVMLKSICSVYPVLKAHGKAMQDLLKKLAASDPRDDLKLAALSLQGPLKAREKKWIPLGAFKAKDEGEDTAMTDAADADDTPSKKLDAKAAVFKPGSTAEGRNGAEDGEIEDEKEAATDAKEAVSADSVKPDNADNSVASTQNGDTKVPEAAARPTASAKLLVPAERSGAATSSRASSTSRSATAERPASRTDTRPPRSEARPPPSRPLNDETRGPERPPRRGDRSPLRGPPPFPRDQNDYTRNGDRRQDALSRSDNRPALSSTIASTHLDRAVNVRPDSARANTRPTPQSNADEMTSVVSQTSINPARAALIQGADRPQQRFDRPEPRVNGHSGRQESDTAPTGPKAGRASGGRDLFESNGGRHGPPEQSRGRLNRDGESTYGRLNGSDVSRAPEGPASRRPPRHSDQNGNARPERPPESPTSKRSQRGRGEAAAEPTAPPAADSGPSVHPSRLANLGVDTSVAQAGRGSAGSPSVPSGPRGHGRPPPGTPTGPSPTSNAPTGPGSAGGHRRSERGRGSGNQAGLSSSPTSNQGVQFRGAAAQNNAPAQPRVLASSMEAPPRPESAPFGGTRVDRGRAELIAQEMNKNEPKRPSRASSRERFPNGGPRQDQYNDRAPQYDGRNERRPGPPSAPGSFAAPQGEWRGDRNDFRGPPRRPESAAGRGPAPGPASEVEGRKRRFEEGQPPPFDQSKRRRSNR